MFRNGHRSFAIKQIRTQLATSTKGLLFSAFTNSTAHPVADQIRFFHFRKLKYLWHPALHRFVTFAEMESDLPLAQFAELMARYGRTGLEEAEVERRLVTYGQNAIEVKKTPIGVTLVKEVISPFYVFQALRYTTDQCS